MKTKSKITFFAVGLLALLFLGITFWQQQKINKLEQNIKASELYAETYSSLLKAIYKSHQVAVSKILNDASIAGRLSIENNSGRTICKPTGQDYTDLFSGVELKTTQSGRLVEVLPFEP